MNAATLQLVHRGARGALLLALFGAGIAVAHEQGVDITAQADCVLSADCDTFTILECDHGQI